MANGRTGILRAEFGCVPTLDQAGVVGVRRQRCFLCRLLVGSDDLAHRLMKAQAEDLDKEVDGVAGLVTLGPVPVAVFDYETGEGGQKEIAPSLFEQLESALLEQRPERCQAGGADLLTRPARLRGVGCQSLCASEAG